MLDRKKSFKLKKLAAGVLAASMSVTLMAGTAFASVDYSAYAPTSGMSLKESDDDKDVATGATAAANTVVLSVLGLDVASTNGAGIYNSSGKTSNYGADSSNLGIFGTDLNDSPDPYLYNFYYNLYTTQSGGGTYSTTDYVAWTAAPYTLLWESNKSGPTGQASGTVEIAVSGYTTKTTNPAFYYEPDILLGGSTNGYASELANYQTAYNSDYNPTVFLGYGTSTGMYAANGSRSDGLGLEYNQFDMCTGVVYLGSVVQNMVNTSGETTRYDQGAYEIAVNYDKYDRGLYYYVLRQIANGSLTQVRYASSLSYDEDTEMYTVKCGTSRAAQYASGIGQDIYELLEDGYTFSDDSSYTQSGSSYLLTVDQLIEILNAPTIADDEDDDANTAATGIIIGSEVSAVDTEYGDLEAAGIRGLDDLPECVYGMTMQTVENGMGIPFYIGYFYYNQDSTLNPANYISYWIENFYHVSKVANMQIIFEQMMDEADSPDGLDYSDFVISDDYSASTVESQIQAGITYYTGTLKGVYQSMATAGEIDSDSALFWTSLDENVGIGSTVQDTNEGYTCTATSSFTDNFDNTIYKYTFTKN